MRFRARMLGVGGALLVSASVSAPAQSVGKMLEYDVRNGVIDMVSVWGTPFHARGRDWLIAAATVAGSAAISPLDDDIDRWFVDHRNSSGWSVLKELREGGVAFSGKTITPVVAGLYVIGLATKSTHIRDGVWGCAASWASSSVVRNYVFYEIIGRRRPDPNRPHLPGAPIGAKQGDQYKFTAFPGSKWGEHSLPAGHVANVAACASFLGNRFDMGIAEPIGYLVATGVGVGRLLDRRHWTSDTFIGAIYGYAVGREVALRSLRRRQSEQGRRDALAEPRREFFVEPSVDGASVGMRWTF